MPRYRRKSIQKRPEHRAVLQHQHVVGQKLQVDVGAVADREHRARLEPRSLTAMLLGDPLPGYSALDRR